MLREPLGKYKVAVCEYDTDYIEGKWKRKIPLMFYYPSDSGNKMCPYKDAAYQVEKSKGNETDNGVKTYCYTDGTIFIEPDDGDKEKTLQKLGLLWEEDISFVIDYLQKMQNGQIENCFSGRLDIENGVNLLGVSFGGCCSIGTVLKDNRAKCAINLDGSLFIDLEPVYTDKPILVLCNPLNYKAHFKLKNINYQNLTVKKIRKITHWEFSDGTYLSNRGKSNREWAYGVSEKRANLCLEFLCL